MFIAVNVFAIFFLLIAMFGSELPSGFYMFLRVVVCATAVYGIAKCDDGEEKNKNWLGVFIVLMLLFNPIIPIPLGRSLWTLVDLVTVILLIVFMVRLKGQSREKEIGTDEEHYDSGKIKAIKPWIYKDKKLGHGLWKYYDENGNIATEMILARGAVYGPVKNYYLDGENGRLFSVVVFDNSTATGEATFYDPEGKVALTVNYFIGMVNDYKAFSEYGEFLFDNKVEGKALPFMMKREISAKG